MQALNIHIYILNMIVKRLFLYGKSIKTVFKLLNIFQRFNYIYNNIKIVNISAITIDITTVI